VSGQEHVAAIAADLAERIAPRRPGALVTLGSGLGPVADEVADAVEVRPADVGLPASTVPGHAGRLIAGTLAGQEVLVQRGRVHRYEGVPADDVVATVRVAAALGCTAFLVTNAAGGVRDEQSPGDLMALSDHLNLTGDTPLVGPQFIDLGGAYDAELRERARSVAAREGIALREGVYAGVRGPAYETPAEVAMLRGMGADAVGMSTVLEVIAARAAGLRVWGCSLLTNVHRPGGTPVDHAEVLAAAEQAGPSLATLLRGLLADAAG